MEQITILEPKSFKLDGVKDEDKNLVQDVLNLLSHTQKLCKSWIVQPYKSHYEIVGSLDTKPTLAASSSESKPPAQDWEIFYDDLDLIRSLNPIRIPLISVRMSGEIPQIRIRIIPQSERVVVHTTDIIRVEKKRRFWGIF